MRLTTTFLIATLLVAAYGTGIKNQATMSLQNTMKKLNQSPWGQVAASFLDL